MNPVSAMDVMKMNAKMETVKVSKMKSSGRQILFVVIAFSIGFGLYDVARLLVGRIGKPIVSCESQIRGNISSVFDVTLPPDASDLYIACMGVWLDPDMFAAFTLSSDESCKMFLSEQFKVPFEKFAMMENPKDFPGNYPAAWPDRLRGNWDLQDNRDLDIYCFDNKEQGKIIYYIPQKCRMYIIYALF